MSEENKNDILKEFFNSNQEPNLQIENYIVQDLLNYIDEPKMLRLHVSLIHRIIGRYLREKPCCRKIIDFIFKCIQLNVDNSVLLNLIDVTDDEEYFLRKIFYERPPNVDLVFLPSTHIIYLLNQKFK